MLNLILTTKKIKSKTIKRFVESKGIENPVTLQSSDLLADMLLTVDSCNLYIFDFIFDLGVVNTVREFKHSIKYLHVFVSDVEAAKAYTPLTDDVFIFPDLYDVMSWFWDSEACRAKNVFKFSNSEEMFCKVNEPDDVYDINSVSVNVKQNRVRIPTTNEDAIQLVLSCALHTKATEDIQADTDDEEQNGQVAVKSTVDEKSQVFGADVQQAETESIKTELDFTAQNKTQVVIEPTTTKTHLADGKTTQKDLDSRAAEIAAEMQARADRAAAKSESKPQVNEAPEPVVNKKPRRGLFSFKEKIAKPAKNKNGEDSSYVSFSDFASVKQEQPVQENVRLPSIDFSRTVIEQRFDTIAEYCLAKGFVSQADHDSLMKGLQFDRLISRDDQWANKALADNKITEEQLIQATMAVKNLGILSWEEVDALKPDLQTFGLDKCKKFRFFKIVEPDPLEDRVTLVYSSSLAMLNPELYRMYDNPISKITLDVYIDRKLKEYEQ